MTADSAELFDSDDGLVIADHAKPGGSARTTRRATLAALVLMPIAGAGIGAGTHAQPVKHYSAESVMAIHPLVAQTMTPASQVNAVRYLAAIAKLPEIAAGARASLSAGLSVPDIIRDTKVTAVGGTTIVRIDTHEASAALALTRADALGRQALSFARGRQALSFARGRQALSFARGTLRSPNQRIVILGDFETGDDGWTTQSRFSIAPLRIDPVQGRAKYGTGFLRVMCRATPSCGPAFELHTGFRRGVSYPASAWARSTGPSRVNMVLGSSGTDVAVGRLRTLSPHWQPLRVTWTPRRDVRSAEVTFQTAERRRQTYDLDGVVVNTPQAAGHDQPKVSSLDEARTFGLAESITLAPARPLWNMLDRWMTAVWAVIGGLTGLAIAAVAFWLKHRTGRRQQPK